MKNSIYQHVLWWVLCIIIITAIYSVGLPGYLDSLAVVLMLLPVHLCYYYGVAYLIIPNYLKNRNMFVLVISLLSCVIFSTLLFRLIEILVADPFMNEKMLLENPAFKWKKIQGTFSEQFVKPIYLINAFEQSNTVIWIAISVKYFKLWFEKRQLAMQSELNFLKAKLHPHFLFNTLNNLYSLTLSNSKESPKLILGLSQILRYMLYECDSDSVALARDIEILESYIALEKIRYENRLDLNFSITGEVNEQCIPPLLMFPLVENAFKEGTSEMIGEPWINIDLEINRNHLKFKVSNSKPIHTLIDPNTSFVKTELKNLRKRLDLLFQDHYELHVFEEEEMSLIVMQIELNYPH